MIRKALLPLTVLFIASFAAQRAAHAQTPANQIQIRAGFAVERVYVPKWKGGSNVKPKRESVMKAVIAMLGDEQRQRFARQIAATQQPPAVVAAEPRALVKQWKLEDLVPALEAGLKQQRNLENGRSLYTAANCMTCHSFQGEGGLAGPDLTNAGGRYSPRDLLDNILNPSKVINEQYGQHIYLLKDGKQIVGRAVETDEANDNIVVATNPTNPLADHVGINRNNVESITPSRVSSMPEGALNTLTQDEVLDLLAYLIGR